MVFTSWLKRFRQSLEERARVQRALLEGSLQDELRERPARGRRMAHRNPMGQMIEVVEERTLLSSVTFMVNTTADLVDLTPIGDGVVDVDLGTAGNQVSLRGAIQEANASMDDDVEIVLGPGTYDLDIAASGGNDDDTGDLNITNTNEDFTLVIRGAGAGSTTIDGTTAGGGILSRIFDINANVHRVEIEDVTLSGNQAGSGGGAIRLGTNSFLELDEVTIADSTSDNDGGGLRIEPGGFATVVDSVFDGNSSGGADAGAIYNQGSLVVANSLFNDNDGGDGGAILARGSSVTDIQASRFFGNTAANDGGAIYVDGVGAFLNVVDSELGASGMATRNTAGRHGGAIGIASTADGANIERSTLAGNLAVNNGGGIHAAGGFVSVTNTTISDNEGVNGGGIRGEAAAAVTLTNSTIAFNTANAASGGAVDTAGFITTFNTIFSNSQNVGMTPIGDVSGTVAADANNIVQNATGAIGFTGSDLVGVDPLLLPLADNGGGVPTHALDPDDPMLPSDPISPAIDAANTSLAATSDGRRLPRISSLPDIGAYEEDPFAVFVNLFTDAVDANPVDGTADSDLGTAGDQITLRSAIMALNTMDFGNGIIVLPAGHFELTLTSGGGADGPEANDLDLASFSNPAHIVGAGALSTTIDASTLQLDGTNPNGDDRVLQIAAGTVTIDGVTIENGDAGTTADGGGILLDFGSLVLKNSDLEDNRAQNGGGLATGFSSIDDLILDGVSVVENTATMAGGGVAVFSFFTNTPEFIDVNVSRNTAGTTGGALATGTGIDITGFSTFIRNSSGTDGGAIAADTTMVGGVLRVTGATVRENMSGGHGGGIAVTGESQIVSTLVEMNTATLTGGGIAAGLGRHEVNSSEIVDNSSSEEGGGVSVGDQTMGQGGGPFATATAEISFTAIDGNVAGTNGGGLGNEGGSLRVFASTVEGNTAPGSGGGLANTAGGVTEIVSSTFSGNTATNGAGGGLAAEGGMVELTNATITQNTADVGGGVATLFNTPTLVQNTIVAGNTANSFGTDVLADTVITSGGNNLIGVGGAGFVNGVNGDQVGSVGTPRDPMLGPLQNNGGKTQTHELLGGSPAIDAGNAGNLDFESIDSDVSQRGAIRIVGAAVDIGAFEVQAPPAPIFVTSLLDDGGPGTLRSAIDAANINPDTNVIVLPAGTIRLSAPGSGEDSNATGDLDVTRNVIIQGAGVDVSIIDGLRSDRIFEFFGVTAELRDLTLTNGMVGGDGGAIRTDGGTTTIERGRLANNEASGFGGAVFNAPGASSLIVLASVIENNLASGGGGTYSFLDPVTFDQSRVRNNVATSGDGGGFVADDSNLTIFNSEFLGNSAPMGRGGGGFINDTGSSTNNAFIDGARFSGNTAASGGALSINDATDMGVQTSVTISASEFGSFPAPDQFYQGNSASVTDGGAIENVGSAVDVFESTFFDNWTGPSGNGGVFSNSGNGASLLVEDSVVGRELGINMAGGEGGALDNNAGATATFRRTTIAYNVANAGGAIANDGVVTVVNSTVSNNTAFAGAGGIDNRMSATATVDHSTVTQNSGGGVAAGGIENEGTLNLKNSIFALNMAPVGNAEFDGGGTFNSNDFNLIGDLNGAFTPAMNDIVGGETVTATVTTATDATPIVITTAAPHTLVDGELVRIEGVMTNMAANGTFRVGFLSATTFELFDPINGTAVIGGGGLGTGGQVFRLADAQLDLTLQNNTLDDGEGMAGPVDVDPDAIQPIESAVPFTHVPLLGSPVIDTATNAGIEFADNRGLPRDTDIAGVGASGSAPDRGSVEVFYATVTGRKFDDVNGNGIDDGESGLPGVTVYADVNGNGVLDPTDPSAVTDGSGNYTLTLVPPGTAIISEELPQPQGPGLPGFRQTGPQNVAFDLGIPVGFPTDVQGVTAADFNLDGLVDVAYPDPANDVVVVELQQPGGFFAGATFATGSEPRNIAVDDFNQDGIPDLIVPNSFGNTATILENLGNGTFATFATVAVGTGPIAVATGDFNGDGHRDFATANQGSNNVSVLAGDSMGGFTSLATPTTGNGPVGVTATDLDGDGRTDLATADLTGDSVTVITNLSGAVQTTSLSLLSPAAISHADLDQDGLEDLVVASDGVVDLAVVLLNRGGGVFQGEMLGAVDNPTAITAADVTGDLIPDVIAVGDNATDNVVVFRTDPLGGMPVRTTFDAGDSLNGVALADLNNDGRLDLFTSDVGSVQIDAFLNFTGSHVTTTSSGAVTSGLDFFNQQLGSISGVKFSDLNGNGMLDGGEPLLPGVELFLDVNGNGKQDPFEPTATTRFDDPETPMDETGTFEFVNVVPGEARVYEIVPPGFRQTTQQGPQFDHAPQGLDFGDNAVDSLIVDLDGDGFNDVVVLSQDAPNPMVRVFKGNGTQYVNLAGQVQVGAGAISVSAGDIDGDGDLDLAVANSGADTVDLIENELTQTFTTRLTLMLMAGDQPSDVVLTDLDDDGKADVAVTNLNSTDGDRGLQIFLNNNSTPGAGNYTFFAATSFDTGADSTGLHVADLDNDGDPDIAVTNTNAANSIGLYENFGAGTFGQVQTVVTGTSPNAVTSADFDFDGRQDLAVIASNGGNSLQVFFGTGFFQYGPATDLAPSFAPSDLAVGDFDQDSQPDLVFTNPGTNEINVLSGQGGTFSNLIRFPSLSGVTGLSVGEIDSLTNEELDILAVQNSPSADIDLLLSRFGSIAVSVASGGMVTGLEFGNVELGTLSGTKFLDENENGIFDPGEDPLPGFVIFLDLDRDGVFSPDFEPSTTTDMNGFWQLDNVPVNMPVSVAEVVTGTGFAQTAPSQFLLGEFIESDTPDGPDQTVLGDLDGDGDNDIVVANLGINEVSIGLIDSVTGEVTRSSFPAASLSKVALADVDGDGDLDILAAGAALSVVLNTGGGVFGAVNTFGSGSFSSLVVGDFDGDGDIDAAAADTSLTPFVNNGSGVFAPQSPIALSGRADFAVTADLDGDMDLDLAVTIQTQDNFQILKNDGSGGFSVTQTGTLDDAPVGLAVADFDTASPGLELLTASSGDNTFQLLNNNGSGTFTPEAGIATGHVASIFVDSADLNGDGHADFVITDFLGNDIFIGLGNGAGGFMTQSESIGNRQTGVTLADITNNGRPDIVVAINVSDRLVIFPNRTGSHDLMLTAGQSIPNLDFGNRALPGSISGIKFRDDNANGIQDGGEPGLPGFTIYIDENNNGMFDGGEPSAVTDAMGRYTITGLAGLESHRVSEVGQAGFEQTFPQFPAFSFAGDVAAGGPPLDIVTGDFDGMHGDDIAVSLEATNQVAVLLRESDGSFGMATTYGVGGAPFSLVTADFDQANGLDLLVANEDDGTVTLLLNDGMGDFTPQLPLSVGADPFGLAVGNLDQANGPDLVVVNLSLNTFRVFTNDGGGGLSAGAVVGTGAPPTSVAIADFDQDTDPDIAVTTEGNSLLTVYAQTSPGVFTARPAVSTGSDPAVVQAANLNGDAIPDLVVINQLSQDATVILNNSSGGTLNLASPVNYPTGLGGESLVVLDVNDDTALDILTSGEEDNSVALLLNNGAGVFSAPTLFSLDDTTPVELAAIDLDGDQNLDIAITDEAFGEVVLISNAFGSHTPVLGPGENLMGIDFGNQDIQPPIITDPNITISGATGTGGAFRVGDMVTATWDNSAGGDNNTDVATVTIDFTQFGGGAAVPASETLGMWSATFMITEDGGGSIDAVNRNVSVTATDEAGNMATTADTTNATVDNDSPVVTDANISIAGATGTSGAFRVGDTVTATWDNSPSGDNNADTISGVTVDFTQFGGGAAVAATETSGMWMATFVVSEGSIDATNRNVSVTATDNAGNVTTTADTTNATVDNESPVVTDGAISIAGATGTGGAFKVGDTVTATWDNSPTGDNNTDTISGVTVDFTQFGGGAAVAATETSGMWMATFVVTAGSIDATNRNVSVTATDNAGNTTTTADATNATVDNESPVVTDNNIAISGATGSGSAFIVGDTVTATWNNTAGGDNNTDTISGVTVDFTAFGGGSAVAATESSGTWTATFTITEDGGGVIDATNRNVSVTATDNAGNMTTTGDTTNATVDNDSPVVTDANISISGATGTGGAFKAGDTVTATWDNTAGGDNNSDTISAVTVDFTQFGGGSAVAATESTGTWTATFTITEDGGGAIDATNRNVSVTATDNAGNMTTTADTTNATVDNDSPVVTDANISIGGATGTAGAFRVGDTVTATWNNTAGGDNNSDTIPAVTVDFSQFGGGSAVAATESSGTWTATFTITEDGGGSIDATNRNVSVTATDDAGNMTTTADTTNATVDNDSPVVTDANISISGATGTGGAFRVGDTVTATWNNTGGGDNNSDTISAVTVDFSQFGGGSAVAATESTGTWTATFTITEDGGGSIDATNRNVSVTATDNAGNSTTTADTTNATVDNDSPVVTDANISISGATGTGGAFRVGDTVTATWDNTAGGDNNSDTISGVTVDFTPFGGGAAVAATESTGTWTATFTITEDGGGSIDATNRNVSVTATDNAGNTTTTADTTNATVDNDSPVVTDTNISIGGATGTGGAFKVGDTVTATWNNTAGGDNNADTISAVTVDFTQFGGGAAVAATESSGTWTATLLITEDGGGSIDATNLNVSVTATDNAGNSTTTADTTNATLDNNSPDVMITDDEAGTANIAGGTITYTFTFTEGVFGFTVGDVTVSGGTKAASFAGGTDGDSVYTLVVTPNADFEGNLTVDVAAAVAVDDAGNSNSAAAQSVQAVDTLAPTMTVNIVDNSLTDADRNSNVTFTVSETTADFAAGDVSATNGVVTGFSGSGTSYSATYTADDGIVATGSVDVMAGTFTDAAGNPGVAGSDTVAIDTNDGPVIGNLNGEILMFTEGDGPSLLNQDGPATVTDADSANFDGGSLHVSFPMGKLDADDLSIRNEGTDPGQIGFDGETVTFGGVPIGAFTEGSVMVTFNANATPTAAAALLNNIVYDNPSDVPTEMDRMIRFDLDDGAGGAFSVSTVTTIVEVTAVNDAPFFASAVPSGQAFTEGGDPVRLVSSVDLVDFENDATGSYDGMQVFIERASMASSDDVFSFDTSGPVSLSGANVIVDGQIRATVSLVDGEATITFNANTRESDVDLIIGLVTYENLSENPPSMVTLEALIDDGDGGLSPETPFPVTIIPVNDAPVLAGIEPGTLAYLEGDGDVPITNTLTVTDADDMLIESATVSITDNYQQGVDCLFVNPSLFESSVVADFDEMTGVLTLTGSDTLLSYQTLLRAVTFETKDSNPAENTRTISFQINDGELDSNVLTRDISVALRPVRISGVVWLEDVEDGDRDDSIETGEGRVEGVLVTLFDGGGNQLATDMTAGDGSYSFNGQSPGTFRVGFTAPDFRHFTLQDAFGFFGDLTDSDASRQTGLTGELILGSGDTEDNVDAGLVVTRVAVSGPGQIAEGSGGGTTIANFNVSLNGPSTHVVTVNVTVTEIDARSGNAATLDGANRDFPPLMQNPVTITFQPGETTKPFTLPILKDDDTEPDEDIDVVLSSPTQAIVDPINGDARLTIQNDDALVSPIIELVADPAPSVDEVDPLDSSELVFKVRVVGMLTEDTEVFFETVDMFGQGIATPVDGEGEGGDYIPLSGSVIIPAGQDCVEIPVQIIGDLFFEPAETVRLRLTSVMGSNAILGTTREVTGTINASDNETPTVRVLDGMERELNAPLTPGLNFVVRREGSASLPILIEYRTVLFSGDGVAEQEDFIPAGPGSTLVLDAGQTEGVIPVNLIGDGLFEGNETFGIELESARRILPMEFLPMEWEGEFGFSDEVLIGRAQATGTIVDDDAPPTLSLLPASTVEGNVDSFVEVTAELSAVSTQDVNFTVSTIPQTGPGIATADGMGVENPDYTPLSGFVVTVPAGFTSVTFPIGIIGDLNVESDETFRVQVTSSDIPVDVPEAVVTIGTDDRNMATASVVAGDPAQEFDGVVTSALEAFFQLDARLNRNVTFHYSTLAVPFDAIGLANLATPDVDFVSVTNGQATVLAGELSTSVTITVLPDDMLEASLEDVFIEIDSISIGPEIVSGQPEPAVQIAQSGGRAKLQIRDNDGATSLGFPMASFPMIEVPEGDVGTTAALVTFNLSAPASEDLEVFYRTETLEDSNAAIPGTIGLDGLPVIEPGTPDLQRPDFESLDMASIIVPRGATSASVPVRIIGDEFFEGGDETFLVQLLSVVPVDGGVPDATIASIDLTASQSLVKIVEDEFEEQPRLNVTAENVIEGDPGDDVDVSFNLSLTGRIRRPVEIRVRTSTVEVDDPMTEVMEPFRTVGIVGLADINGNLGDVFFTERLVTLDSEVTSADVLVGVIEDNMPETNELVILEILSVDGAVLPPEERIAVAALIDDDNPDAATFGIGDVTVLEGDDNTGTAVATVTLSVDPADLGGPVTVRVRSLDNTALDGIDYTGVDQVLTFQPGTRTQTVTVPILGNLLDESVKRFVLQLSEPSVGSIAGTGQGIVSITNDDSPDVDLQIDSVTLREGDTPGTVARFTVTAIGQSASDVLVDFETVADTAEAGDDFQPVSGTLRFPGGTLDDQFIDVPIVSDNILEEELEQFVVRLFNPRFDFEFEMEPEAGMGEIIGGQFTIEAGEITPGSVEVDPAFAQGTGVIQDDDQRVFREDADAQLQIIIAALNDLLERFDGNREDPMLVAEAEVLIRAALVATTGGVGGAFLFDPVDFLLTDTQNRMTGYTATSGEVTETARSYYSGDGNIELVILPDATGGMFPLQLSGVGSGEFLQVATVVNEDGNSKTIANAGTLPNGTELPLMLDFTDIGQNNNFPRPGDDVFAQLADGDGNAQVNTQDALAVSAAAVDALAELQRQRQEDIRPVEPGVFFAEYYNRTIAITPDVMDAVWDAFDSIFEDVTETPDSIPSAFWKAFGRTVLGTPDGLFEIIDLLELLRDGAAESEATEEEPADDNGNNEAGDAANEEAAGAARRNTDQQRDRQAAQTQQRKASWLEEAFASADSSKESPWAPTRPGDRKVHGTRKAVANRPRFVDIARKMQGDKQETPESSEPPADSTPPAE